ncbi:MAG: sodium-dependent transporter [Clostridia bacterium]|nr:sodium-dependent transporter [Clostridia bacterium]
MEQSKRSSFTGKIGFVLAAAGSAVGLGNIWRFPYLAAKYGGGIFLLVYIILSVTFGFSLMIAEITIGRKTQLSPVEAYKSLDKRFSFIGYLSAIVPMLILPYYSVIGGWVMKYAFSFTLGQGSDMANGSFFTGFIGKAGEPILWFAIFVALTAGVIFLGVQKGIEKVSKIMMPALVVLMLFIVIYSLCTVDGALDGVLYYITPDFSKFSVMTVVAAMGQLFYSMSLAMGIMITFGSYMKKEISIEKSTHQIEIFDTGIAFLAGLMIVPVCVATDPNNLTAGPSLMFITMPKIFDGMPAGNVIGAIFFLMVLLAALTSSISLMETVVSTIQDKWRLSRNVSCFTVIGISITLGLLSCFGFSIWSGFKPLGLDDILTFFDFLTNSVMMPIIALSTSIFIGYFLKPKAVIDEVELNGNKLSLKGMFSVIIRYIAPVMLLIILVSSVLDGFGIINI